MNPSYLAVRHPRLLALVVLTLTVWGGLAMTRLPRQEDPALTWRLANVITRLPGASPERMESLVTDVLERFVEEVDEVEHIYSVSRAGVSLLQIELRDDVTVAFPVWERVRHKLSQAVLELPTDVLGPDLDDEIMGTFSQLIAITGADASDRELKDQAQRLEDRLRYLPLTASTSLFGVQPEVIQVELNPSQLAAYRLSFEQIAGILRSRHVQQPAGRLTVGESEVLIEASGELKAEEQVRQMVLAVTPAGHTLRLGDVARIIRTTRSPSEPHVRYQGRRAVVLGVRARPGARMDQFGEQVGREVEQFQGGLGAAVQCTVFHDLAHYTRENAAMLSGTLLFSMASVFLSMFLFSGWRGATVVTATIPLTGLIALVVFSVLGVPLNQMSLMALIMAFGLLVDNAIIVAEEVQLRADKQVELAQAAIEQGVALFMPLLVSTLTTVAAFVPIYLLPGGMGEFVRAIPVGLAICLIVSLLVSLTATPWLCSVLLRSSSAARRPPLAVSVGRRWVAWFPGFLARSIRRPGLTLTLTGLVTASLAVTGWTLRRDFFSPVQRDQFVVDVFAAEGSALEHTARIVGQIENLLARQEGIVDTASFIGRNAPLIFYNLESQETYANRFAQIVVRVKDWRHTAELALRAQNQLDASIGGADCCSHLLEHGAPFIAPFEVRIRGDSTPTLREIGRRVAALFHNTSGVRNVRINYGPESLKLVTQVNEAVARRIGIDQGQVADQLRHSLDGLVATHVDEGDERIAILLRYPGDHRRDISDLQQLYFKPASHQGLIPFSAVATLVPAWEESSIYRRDGARTLSVLAYPAFGLTAAEVGQRLQIGLRGLQQQLPPDCSLELGGENEQRQEAEGNLLHNSVYALFPIVLLLMMEFHSLRLCAVIFAIIPLSLAGSLVGLWLTGWPLNFMALMGMMMLTGVAVNDAVVLIDGFERRRSAGEAPAGFVISVTLERWRHIVLTSITTVAGFLPLALSPSLLWPPLAIAIIGGITLETVIVLVAVPAAYTLARGDVGQVSNLPEFS